MFGWFTALRSRYRQGPSRLGYRVRAHLPMNLGYLPGVWWVIAWLCSHVTIPGAALAFLLMTTSGFALTYGRFTPVGYAFFMVAGLLLTDFIVGLLLLPRVRVTRELAAHGMEGGVLEVSYTLHNAGRLAARNIEVEPLPWPSQLHLEGERPRVALLLPGETVMCRLRVRLRRRGVYVLPEPRVTFAFPFGAWVWGRYGEGARHISVQPAFSPLQTIASGLGVRQETSGERVVDQNATSMEFFGCRDYREGDNPRHLHPRSWARVGFPVVKEFQDECRLRTALVVDTSCTPTLRAWARGYDPLFEAGMQLSAAIAEWLARKEHVIELFAAGQGVYRFTSEGRSGFLAELLDILAALDPLRDEPLNHLLELLEDELARIQSVLLVLLRWDQNRSRAIDALRARGVEVSVVLLHREGDEPPDVPGGRPVSARMVLEGGCERL
jgi:uncharacterized protein (DUF58 family)